MHSPTRITWDPCRWKRGLEHQRNLTNIGSISLIRSSSAFVLEFVVYTHEMIPCEFFEGGDSILFMSPTAPRSGPCIERMAQEMLVMLNYISAKMVSLPYTDFTSLYPCLCLPSSPRSWNNGCTLQEVGFRVNVSRTFYGLCLKGIGLPQHVSGRAEHLGRDKKEKTRASKLGLEYWPLRSHSTFKFLDFLI